MADTSTDTATLTDTEISDALVERNARRMHLVNISTAFMPPVLILPILGVCACLLPVAPAIAVGGFVAGLLGALGCFVASEIYNVGVQRCDADIECLQQEASGRKPAAPAAAEPAATPAPALAPAFARLKQDDPARSEPPARGPGGPQPA